MNFRAMLFLGIAFGLMAVSHGVELQGDAAPLASEGVSPERLGYHLMALFLLLGALGCFVYAGVSLVRGRR